MEPEEQASFRVIETEWGFACSMTSSNNILAVGSRAGVQLWDVRNWEKFHSSEYKMIPRSIHLTHDSKYLTVGGSGWNGEKCVVLEIQ